MNESNKLLSDIVAFRTYAKYISHLQRRETLSETTNRTMNMHLDRFPKMSAEITKAFSLVHDLKIMPSMRSMQFSGEAVISNNSRSYNCSFVNITYQRVFSEILFLLLSGTGVGFSVQNRHINQLPNVRKPKEEGYFRVHDSIEGWAQSLNLLIDSYFNAGIRPEFDFSGIRPKGSYLVTTGAKAPGPEPLRHMLTEVDKMFTNAIGRKLRAIEVHDIICLIADCVLAGGIRRAALISLFDKNNEEMLKCKSGSWWEKAPFRARANNSVVLHRSETTKEEFDYIYDMCRQSNAGEPGVFWTNDYDLGTNPCFTGETMVAVADGRGYVSFKELAESGKDVPVFSLDSNGKIISKIMRRPRISGRRKKIYKITLDDGNIIRATENHKFILNNGDIIELKDLKKGDSLRVMTKFNTGLFSKKNSQKYTFIRSVGQTRAEHRIIAEQHYNIDLMKNSDKITVHHVDHNAINNSPENLKVMTVEEHDKLHSERMFGKNNPVHKILNSDKREEYLGKISLSTKESNNPNYCGVTNEELIEHSLKLTKSLGRMAFSSDWEKYAKENGLPIYFSKWRKTHLGGIKGFLTKAAIECGFKYFDCVDSRVIKRLYYYLNEGYDCFIHEGELLFNKICEYSGEHFITKHPEAAVKYEYSASYSAKIQWETKKASMLDSINASHQRKKEIMREKQAGIFNNLKFSFNREPLKNEWKEACKENGISGEISRTSSPFKNYESLKEYSMTANHKVISIEEDGFEDVYNGTVDDTHNFFVGKFISPTKDGEQKIISINTMNCAEISLNSQQFCNLTSINQTGISSEKEFFKRIKAAAIIGTLQASYTSFPYLSENWQKQTEAEALLGVSFTGVADNMGFITPDLLKQGAKLVLQTNEEIAKKIGINVAARTSAVKPEGTVSTIVGSASGVHDRHSQWYIRRIRMNGNDPLAKYLGTVIPDLIEQDIFSENGVVVSIPQESPKTSVTRDKSTALDMLKRANVYNVSWIKEGHRSGLNTHNCSVTISVRDHEWDELKEEMWNTRDQYTGVSLLPYDGGTYQQAPFEEISIEKYQEMEKLVKVIDLTKVREVEDFTNRGEIVACAGSVCEVSL